MNLNFSIKTTMKKNLKQKIINSKTVIENGINGIMKMTLTLIMYVERQVLLQEQKRNIKEQTFCKSLKNT